jgi:translocation and assembly module TamB
MAASVAGFRRFSEPLSPLAIGGRIDLANFDLSVLSGISSNMMEPTGRADSSFEISGTIGEPSIQGQLNIGGGGIELPYQGITLEDVNLSLGAEDHGVRVVCTGRSGPGKIISKGVIHYSTDGVSGTLAISGDNFLVVDLPEYGIRVNPALKFSFVGTKATVDGTVFVPYGRITPEEITN